MTINEPPTTCQQKVRIDNWHDRVCGRPIKKNDMCSQHAAARQRQLKGDLERMDKRRRGQAAADLLTKKIGMVVYHHGFGSDDYFTINAAAVYRLLEEEERNDAQAG